MNISRDLSNYLVALTGTPYLLRESFLGSDLGKEFLFASDAEVQTLLHKHSMTRYSQLIDAISYEYRASLSVVVFFIYALTTSLYYTIYIDLQSYENMIIRCTCCLY